MNDTARIDALVYADLPRPAKGEVTDVAPGVRWLRMPLPFMLGHINLWLLDDGDGWTVVDTGIPDEASKAVWERVFADELDGKPVKRVMVTHLHPDHCGLAGWLCRRWDVPLWMTRTEYLMCRNLVHDTGHPAPQEGVAFYRAAGFDAAALERYQKRFGLFGKAVSPMPSAYRRLEDGQKISVGANHWQVMVGNGHSPEHACLFCPEQNVIISGDQILPTISSNVSVWPTEPCANPLKDWLESCDRLRRRLPEDVLVLPAHGRPFRGARARLSALIGEHEEGLDALYGLCETPRRAVDVFEALFKGQISDSNLIMAVGESVAHLTYLVEQGNLTSWMDDGVRWYRQASELMRINETGH